MSVMELGHLLTRSVLTYLEVSSEVCHDSLCHLGNSVSLSWVVCPEAFYLHVVSSSSCIPVVCLEPVLLSLWFCVYISLFHTVSLSFGIAPPSLKNLTERLVNFHKTKPTRIMLYEVGHHHQQTPPHIRYKCKVKVKLTLYHATKAHRGSKGIALPFFNLSARLRGGGGGSIPRPALTPGKRLGIHYIGGWVNPRAAQGGCGKSPPPPPRRDSIPGPSSP